MRHSLGIVVTAMLFGMQINSAAAQAGEDLPPPPPDTNAAPAGQAPANTPAPGVQPAAAPASNGLPSIYGDNSTIPAPDNTRTAKNALYAELLGNGILYSLNYERFLTDDFALRIGLGLLSLSASGTSSNSGDKVSAHATLLWVPLMVNYLGIGTPDHKLQLGLGPVLFYASAAASSIGKSASASGATLWGTATIGYRYVPHDGGFNFDIGFTPVFGSFGFLPWFGIGFGAVF